MLQIENSVRNGSRDNSTTTTTTKKGILSLPSNCVVHFRTLFQKNQLFGFKIYTLSSKLVTEMNSSSDSDVFINIEVMLKDIQAFKILCVFVYDCM